MLTTNSNTTLLFNLNLSASLSSAPIPTNGYSIYGGDLISLSSASTTNLTVNPGSTIALGAATVAAFNPNATGDYRLFYDPNVGSAVLSNFTLPTGVMTGGTSGYSMTLSSTVDSNYIDLVVGTVALPGIPTWSTSSGNWSNTGNWSTVSLPPTGGTAVLGTSASGPVTVTLDIPATLGVLQFQGSSGANYTIATSGTNALTMNSGGTAAYITVNQGNHAINPTVNLAGSLLDVQTQTSGDTLTINGSINDNNTGASLELDGPGTLVLSGSNAYGETTGWTLVNPNDGMSGTLVVASSTALPFGGNLAIGSFPNPYAPGAVMAGSPLAASQMASPAGVAAVPEPSALALLGVAGLLAAAAAWRKRSTEY